METALTRLLGIEIPIVQAPIGGLSNPRLAAAVSNAGGLGTLALTWTDLDAMRTMIRTTRNLTDRPFAINLILDWPQEERLAVALEEGVSIVSFFWGDPAAMLPAVHAAGAVAMLTVGSSTEAERAVRDGVDVIVAQGWEAGGHVWGDVATMALVPAVVDAIPGTPVVAAGGIGDGRGLAAALALGAAGVWMGTRFIASAEAAAHPEYLAAVQRARESDTYHSSLFDVGWPDAPHRVLRNRTIDSWEAAGRPPSGSRPGEGEVVARDPAGEAVVRYSSTSAPIGTSGNITDLSLWAGQSVGLVHDVRPAAEIVATTAAEADEILARLTNPKAHGTS